MSYDLCEIEECLFTHPFSPLSDSSSNGILKSFQESNYNLNTLIHNIHDTPLDEIDQIAPTRTTTTTTLPSSPPCSQFQSLSTYQMGNSVNSKDLCHLDIKAEESQPPFCDSYMDINSFLPHSYGGCDNSEKMMQRRVCSTGDLHSLETKQALSSSPLGTGSLMEEVNFKVGRYSPEERKERILRYKEKRTQRNFNKTIKYACRKTLADNRPRIRGRFARSDEPQDTPKAFTFQQYVNEDELWMEGLQEEYLEGITREHIFNTYMPTAQFHQSSFFRN